MRPMFVILALTLPMHTLSAEELAVRCDHIGSPGAVLLFFNTDRNTVRWGKGPNSTLFADNRKYQTHEEDTPKKPDYPGSVGCIFSWSEYVHVSDDKIEFGKSAVNTNWCGMADRPTEPRAEKKNYAYSIDRTTGLANLSNDTEATPDYECQRYAGNPI
jgi:hypothetical protein